MFNWSIAQSMNRSKDASISMMNAGALAIMSAHCASVGVVLVVMSGSGVRPPYHAIGTSGWQPSKSEDIPLVPGSNPQSVHDPSTRPQSSLSYKKSAHHTAEGYLRDQHIVTEPANLYFLSSTVTLAVTVFLLSIVTNKCLHERINLFDDNIYLLITFQSYKIAPLDVIHIKIFITFDVKSDTYNALLCNHENLLLCDYCIMRSGDMQDPCNLAGLDVRLLRVSLVACMSLDVHCARTTYPRREHNAWSRLDYNLLA